jgi:membrane-associated phospholipid phosphatase
MFTYLSLVTKDQCWQFLYCVAAFLVGYSRIYLSQHFPADVLAGTIIGTSLAILGGSIWLPNKPNALL